MCELIQYGFAAFPYFHGPNFSAEKQAYVFTLNSCCAYSVHVAAVRQLDLGLIIFLHTQISRSTCLHYSVLNPEGNVNAFCIERPSMCTHLHVRFR